MSKTIGILGGMGPEATLYLFRQIVRLTGAVRDQDHVPVLIWNNPKIPDRTPAVLEGATSPLPELIEGAQLLEKAGADMIVMPCVTAHYFYDDIIKHISIPFLHLLDTAYRYMTENLPFIRRTGVIATRGTIRSGLIQESFNRDGREVIAPDDEHIRKFHNAIYTAEGIKAGYKKKPKQLLLQVATHLEERHAEAVIAGCSEIPLVIDDGDLNLPFINPLKILAIESIKTAGYETKTA